MVSQTIFSIGVTLLATLLITRGALLGTRLLRLGVPLLAVLSAVGDPSAGLPSAAASKPNKITILHVNDTYQLHRDGDAGIGGLARIATLRREVAREAPNSLFFFAGDTFSAGHCDGSKGRRMIQAWNSLGVDYVVVGNHELGVGPSVLKDRIRESRFHMVGSERLG